MSILPILNVFTAVRCWRSLKKRPDLTGRFYNKASVLQDPEAFKSTEYIFSTWGMPSLDEKEIAGYFPNLKCVFYAAGSVQYFAEPFLKSGIKVFSAWAANAVPVADYTAAQIVLALKGFFASSRLNKISRKGSTCALCGISRCVR